MKFNTLTVILFSLGLMVVSLFAVNSSSAAIDPGSVVGIWLFDDGTGGMAMDSSGNENHGTIANAPVWVDGRFGGALAFDGGGNCVSTGQQLLNGRREFTVVAWVKPGNITENRVGIIGQNDSPEFGFINPNTIMLWTPSAGGTENPYPHPAGEWHHVAAVATGEYTKVYVDGEATMQNGSWSDHGRSDFNVNIGGCGIWDATGNWFTGAIDEVGLFHAPLSDDDIADIMNNGLQVFGVAVEPAGKIAVAWGMLKQQD